MGSGRLHSVGTRLAGRKAVGRAEGCGRVTRRLVARETVLRAGEQPVAREAALRAGE